MSAYKNGDLSLIKMNYFIRCLKKICKKRLVYINGNNQQCYYMPKDMEIMVEEYIHFQRHIWHGH